MQESLVEDKFRYTPLVTIVIPTRNESEDIAGTLETCLRIEYEPKEVLVVDDSSDDTPQIVQRYSGRGVRLIHREQNRNGCCGARNEGMRNARGELVTFFNADDRPSPDFLRKMVRHFAEGADYVVAQSKVQNQDNIWARYIRAGEVAGAARPQDQEWSEGFTCRLNAARTIGYIPGDFPVPFCRDWMLGKTLGRAGYVKHTDFGIVVEHISPGDLGSFWRNQVWRSGMWAPSARFFGGRSLVVILFKELIKNLWRWLQTLAVIPLGCRAFFDAKRLGRTEYFWGMLAARFVQTAAFTVGSLKGVIRIARNLREKCGP
jgi:glycosyltransferase involved in cell wall biosynthesis